MLNVSKLYFFAFQGTRFNIVGPTFDILSDSKYILSTHKEYQSRTSAWNDNIKYL